MAAWDYPLPGPNFQGQPDYAATMVDILSSPGRTLRGIQESDRDYAMKMQQLADARAYQQGSLEVDKQRLADQLARPDLFGTTQYYDKDAQGNLYPYIISKTGQKKYIGAEPGRSVATKTVPVDTGTGTTFRDPYNPGAPGATIPKDVAGAASAEAQGKTQAAAAANLPVVEDATNNFNRDIDAVMNDPDLARTTGPVGSNIPSYLDLSGGRQRVTANIKKLVGESFLTAYNQLRGAGAITEQEGKAATAAMNQLTATDVADADYKDYLQQARDRMNELLDLARRRAAAGIIVPYNGPAPPPPAAPAPPAGGPGAPAPAAAAPAAPAGSPMSVEQWLGGG